MPTSVVSVRPYDRPVVVRGKSADRRSRRRRSSALTSDERRELAELRRENTWATGRPAVPVIGKFTAAHKLPDVTVVADADMISEANQFPVSGTEEPEPLTDGL
jgi:hypothetical protein